MSTEEGEEVVLALVTCRLVDSDGRLVNELYTNPIMCEDIETGTKIFVEAIKDIPYAVSDIKLSGYFGCHTGKIYSVSEVEAYEAN